jgi:hypothetical protein
MVRWNARPWWRDPVWLTTCALCGLILTSAYLYWRLQRQRAAIRVLAHTIRLRGDLLIEDRPREALGYYREAIRVIHERGGGDPGLQAEQAEAQAKIDRIIRGAEEMPAR